MSTRAGLREWRASSPGYGGRHLPALGEARMLERMPGEVATEIVPGWGRSAGRLAPEVGGAPLACVGDTRKRVAAGGKQDRCRLPA